MAKLYPESCKRVERNAERIRRAYVAHNDEAGRIKRSLVTRSLQLVACSLSLCSLSLRNLLASLIEQADRIKRNLQREKVMRFMAEQADAQRGET